MNVFSSIKEINRLVSEEMSNIYLKVTIEKNGPSQNFDFRSTASVGPTLGSEGIIKF